MKSPNYIRNVSAGLMLLGSVVSAAGILILMDAAGYLEPRGALKPKPPVVRSHRIHEHVIPLVEEDYFFEPGKPPGIRAFYEGIMGGKSELGRVTVPADEEGVYFMFTKPGTVCSGCHKEEVRVMDLRLKDRSPYKLPEGGKEILL